jgi:hypothetical protein
MSASEVVLESLSHQQDDKSSPESRDPATEGLANPEPSTPASAVGSG